MVESVAMSIKHQVCTVKPVYKGYQWHSNKYAFMGRWLYGLKQIIGCTVTKIMTNMLSLFQWTTELGEQTFGLATVSAIFTLLFLCEVSDIFVCLKMHLISDDLNYIHDLLGSFCKIFLTNFPNTDVGLSSSLDKVLMLQFSEI